MISIIGKKKKIYEINERVIRVSFNACKDGAVVPEQERKGDLLLPKLKD